MSVHCAACGYLYETHDPGTLKCHPATADKAGRRGKWKDAPPRDTRTWREIMAGDAAAARAKSDAARAPYVPDDVVPPQVPARPPMGPAEIAGYQGKQAIGLGRKAAAAGFLVTALYWRAGDGTEGSGVWLSHDALRALALWSRKPGSLGKLSGWSVDVAYAWRTDSGRPPTPLNHTDLERLFDAPPG